MTHAQHLKESRDHLQDRATALDGIQATLDGFARANPEHRVTLAENQIRLETLHRQVAKRERYQVLRQVRGLEEQPEQRYIQRRENGYDDALTAEQFIKSIDDD